jgi:hypothetical protein
MTVPKMLKTSIITNVTYTLSLKVNKYVRATCDVAFFCQTIIAPRTEGEALTRDRISCKITYSCTGMTLKHGLHYQSFCDSRNFEYTRCLG